MTRYISSRINLLENTYDNDSNYNFNKKFTLRNLY